MIFAYVIYAITIILLVFSAIRDWQKTKKALLKAWKAFENILPQFLGIIVLAGIMLALLNPQLISQIIGRQSGWVGVAGAALVGSVTLIPGFIAFPLAALLLQNGAGISQIGAFISSLMMVGVVTLPVEIRFLGRKVALFRNLLAFAFSFLVALVIGLICA